MAANSFKLENLLFVSGLSPVYSGFSFQQKGKLRQDARVAIVLSGTFVQVAAGTGAYVAKKNHVSWRTSKNNVHEEESQLKWQ